MTAQKLWNKNFLLLWLGHAQSGIGNALYIVALSYLILDLTGSPKFTAITMAAAAAPYILSPLAGTIVDRIHMKRYLVIGDFVRGSLMLIICLFGAYGTLNVLMIVCVALLLGFVGLIYRPSFAVLLPRLVPQSDVGRANALNGLTGQISNLLGFSFGGVLVAWMGPISAIFINGVTFCMMAFLLMLIQFPNIHRKSSSNINVWAEVREGFQFLLSSKILFMIPIIFFFMNISYSPLEILMPLKMKALGKGPEGYGIFFAILFIGAIMVSAWISKFGKNLNTRLNTTIGLSAMALALGGVAASPNFFVCCVSSLVFGAGTSLVSTSNVTYVQTEVDESFRGRIFGIFGTVEQVGMPASLALIGFFVDIVKPEVILYTMTLLLVVVSSVWFVVNKQSANSKSLDLS